MSETFFNAGRALVRDRGGCGHLALTAHRARRDVKRHLYAFVDVQLPPPESVGVDVELARDLRRFRLAAKSVQKCLTRTTNRSRFPPRSARHVIVAPELVKHRSANPRHRVGTEGETSRWLVARGGLKEAHCAGADQLIEVDLVMQSAGELARDMVNEADV